MIRPSQTSSPRRERAYRERCLPLGACAPPARSRARRWPCAAWAATTCRGLRSRSSSRRSRRRRPTWRSRRARAPSWPRAPSCTFLRRAHAQCVARSGWTRARARGLPRSRPLLPLLSRLRTATPPPLPPPPRLAAHDLQPLWAEANLEYRKFQNMDPINGASRSHCPRRAAVSGGRRGNARVRRAGTRRARHVQCVDAPYLEPRSKRTPAAKTKEPPRRRPPRGASRRRRLRRGTAAVLVAHGAAARPLEPRPQAAEVEAVAARHRREPVAVHVVVHAHRARDLGAAARRRGALAAEDAGSRRSRRRARGRRARAARRAPLGARARTRSRAQVAAREHEVVRADAS